MTETTEETPAPRLRHKPRNQETISIGGRTKWRFDAICLAGRRSRTATLEVLMDHFLRHNPSVRDWVEEHARDPKPIRTTSTTAEQTA